MSHFAEHPTLAVTRGLTITDSEPMGGLGGATECSPHYEYGLA
jgi:hypothetical protein